MHILWQKLWCELVGGIFSEKAMRCRNKTTEITILLWDAVTWKKIAFSLLPIPPPPPRPWLALLSSLLVGKFVYILLYLTGNVANSNYNKKASHFLLTLIPCSGFHAVLQYQGPHIHDVRRQQLPYKHRLQRPVRLHCGEHAVVHHSAKNYILSLFSCPILL